MVNAFGAHTTDYGHRHLEVEVLKARRNGLRIVTHYVERIYSISPSVRRNPHGIVLPNTALCGASSPPHEFPTGIGLEPLPEKQSQPNCSLVL